VEGIWKTFKRQASENLECCKRSLQYELGEDSEEQHDDINANSERL
jgi:hypothetical protein